MPKIIVLDPLSQDGIDLLDSAGNLEYEVRTGLKGEELRKALCEFDGAICRSGVKLTADVLEGNQRLKAIVRAGVGTDNIDKDAATRLGIAVMNTPGGNTISTAEQTITLMMALSRSIYPAYASLVEGRWDRKNFMGTQLAGKTLGIIGLGRIGQAVATRAQALEMKIIGYDPFLSAARANELGIETYGSPKELLPLVDYLTVHTPLTDETRGLVGREELKTMRKGVRLINCARGGIYDEAALVEGLKSGQIGGVALDVFVTEPCTDSPLFGMPNVLCTPHLGASTEEAQTSVAVEGVGLLIDFFTKGEIRQAVNMSPLDQKTLQGLKGYLNVSYRLGMLLAQMDKTPPSSCKLSFEGEVASKDTRLLAAAFAAGLLENALDAEVNLVNAEVLLRERGIELTEQRKSDVGNFSSLIKAKVTSATKTSQAAGTLFGKMKPKLVQKSGCDLEAPLEGTLLIFTHTDTPGVIGKVGSLCGKHRINIASMAVGREVDEPGGNAVGILSLDSQPRSEAVAELLTIDEVKRAWVVNLPPASKMPAWMGG